MSYDIKFRKYVLKVREEECLSFAAVGQRFGISKQTIYNWSKRLEPKLKRNKPTIKIDMASLAEDVKVYPDAYHYERAGRLNVSKSGIWHALKRLGVTYKKNSSASQGLRRKTACLPRKACRA